MWPVVIIIIAVAARWRRIGVKPSEHGANTLPSAAWEGSPTSAQAQALLFDSATGAAPALVEGGEVTAVRRVDAERVDLLKSIFLGFGYDPDRAFIRAPITDFRQVGYHAMEIIEDRPLRGRLRPPYREALVGEPPKTTKA